MNRVRYKGVRPPIHQLPQTKRGKRKPRTTPYRARDERVLSLVLTTADSTIMLIHDNLINVFICD